MSDTKSRFLKVKCPDCGETQMVFDCTNLKVSCNVCGSTMALPKGGKADIKGEIIGRVDEDVE
ncbi:MAG: 30S ribosomal protein S27e [Thermoplasmatota archaeon]